MQRAQAQLSIGGNAYYATELKGFGVGGNVSYQIDKTWSLAANATYYFSKSETDRTEAWGFSGSHNYEHKWGWFTVDINGQFNFVNLDKVGMLYGFSGISLTSIRNKYTSDNEYSRDTTNKNSITGFNIGLGLKSNLLEKTSLEPNMYVTIHENMVIFRIGAKLMFGF